MRRTSCSSALPRLGVETAVCGSEPSSTTGSIMSTSVDLRLSAFLAVAFALSPAACDHGSAGTTVAGTDTGFVEDFASGTLAAWADGVDTTRQRGVTDSTVAQSGQR